MAHDNNYYQTLIAVADDCPVSSSEVPDDRGGKRKSVARVQYEMLAGNPYVYTQEDVLFNTWLTRQEMPEKEAAEVARLRGEFFAKPKPCLRTSPLAKRYGWGFSFDEQGRVALCSMESKEYGDLIERDGIKVLKAMKSS